MDDRNNAGHLIDSTIEMVAEEGLIGLTTKKIAKHAGISEGMIYVYFNCKTDLLNACFFQVDRRIAASFERVDMKVLAERPVEEEIFRLWRLFFKKLLAKPAELIFYRRFLVSEYYNTELAKKRVDYFGAFIKIAGSLIERYEIYDKCPSDLLWDYLLFTTYLFAEEVIRGKFPNNEQTIKQVFNLIYSGLDGLIGSENPEK